MKIIKLYTLSQFVDLMEKSTVAEMIELFGFQYHKLIPITIFKYNSFLKQPLKKEMFVNEFEQPIYVHCHEGKEMATKILESMHMKWCEAEKKVIFKDNQIEGLCNSEFANPKNKLPFRNTSIHDFETLHALAEYYEGGIELQNVIL